MKTFLIILIIILSLAIIVGGYFIVKEVLKPAATTTSATPKASTTASPSTSASGNSDLQSAYDAASDIEASTTKAKTVDGEIKPIFKSVFADKVKLKEDMSGSLLTYITNREILAEDLTAVKTKMETAGYKTLDSADKQITMSKGATTLVMTFTVGDKTKATIDVTL